MVDTLEKIRNKLIVSCQGTKENIFYSAEHMTMFAEAAHVGGARAFRVNSPEHVRSVKEKFPECTVIGISKKPNDTEVFITPNLREVQLLIEAGADIVSMDGTNRKNSENKFAWEVIQEARTTYPNAVIMADIATVEDAILSSRAGADIIATTLNGYTKETAEDIGTLNTKLLKEIKELDLGVFIIAEGRIWTVEEALQAYEAGADSIVIGSAITSPALITSKYTKALQKREESL